MLRVQEICKCQGVTEIANALGVDVVDLSGAPKEGVIRCPKCGTEIKLNPEV